ncbi:hypothetical protein NDU88_005284 [Pleurodeles waltl]|uniref:Uncharacterized protein n=1 Tax=Pleurodeles waltl TaxID=8319 RepID=A0AAV7QIJ4_PLEWA|nr:hypothetical protein NDU88_005284 [Pleurodeles waltl]
MGPGPKPSHKQAPKTPPNTIPISAVPQSRTQSSGGTPDQVRKKKIRSSLGAPENQGNRTAHCRNNKVLRISTTR